MKKNRSYTPEFKAQLVKEAQDLGNLSAVAKNHKIPLVTLRHWVVKSAQEKDPSSRLANKELIKKLSDAELENRVLKELLKKTNQAWLKD